MSHDAMSPRWTVESAVARLNALARRQQRRSGGLPMRFCRFPTCRVPRSRKQFCKGCREWTWAAVCAHPAMDEVLLTVWALSQIEGKPNLSRVIPDRLKAAFRRARKLGYVVVDDKGVYLDDLGSAYLGERGYQGTL